MKILRSEQAADIEDPVRSKFAMAIPVLKATLFSLARDRIARLGGIEAVTLHDLAREFLEGTGDAGICFEYAVHEAVATQNPLIHPIASEVLETHCRIQGGAQSILFGPEKEGVVPILETVTNALTPESVVYVGNRGRPPKLRRYIPRIINAYRRNEERNLLPRSINGIWKADLFVGNTRPDAWVGTTVKINPRHLQGAQGLRLAVYPKKDANDTPRLDTTLNLVRMPLPYDGEFMEAFYKAFFLVRAFLKSEAKIPKPPSLPDAEDRYITKELQSRREYPVVEVLDALRTMAQPGLLKSQDIDDVPVDAQLSNERGLETAPRQLDLFSVSLSPFPRTGQGDDQRP